MSLNQPPPPPHPSVWGVPGFTAIFDRWFRDLRDWVYATVTAAASIAWSAINKTGSNLTDIVTRNHYDLQNLQGGTGSGASAELYHLTAAQNTRVGYLPAMGSANQILGANAAATADEYKTLTAGSNITITHAAGSVTIASSNPGGTVTSVGLSAPAIFSVSGSPVTASGMLALSLANASANTVFAGPTSGGAATPTMRALVAADIPSVSSLSLQSKSGDPSPSDVPAGTCSAWKDTGSGSRKIWCNDGGTLVSVTLT